MTEVTEEARAEPMDDIAKIAAGLSEAQKELAFEPLMEPPFWFKRVVSNGPVISLPALLIERITTQPGYEKFRLTPLGLAVRDYLRSKNDG